MTLYEIDSNLEKLLENSIDPDTGELVDITEELESLQLARAEKVENIALFRKNERAMVDMIDAELKALQERKKAHIAKVKSMDKLLSYATGGQKFETANCLVKFTTSTSTEIEDEPLFILWAEENNAELLTFAAPKPNKTEIKKAIQAGQQIPFCSLQKNENVQVK